MKTLLIVDMQTAWLNDSNQRHDKDGVIARINHAAQSVRAQGGQVVFVRHSNDEAGIGSPEWQVDSRLHQHPSDAVVDKLACDSFSGTSLLAQLRTFATSTLYICGLASEFCVDSTVRSAASQGFDVVALSDAHTTGDRDHLPAASIVAHHNWVWANLAAPHGVSVSVQTVHQAFPAA